MSKKTIKSWSFSTWGNYNTCPAKAAYRKIHKLEDPAGPAAERGNYIHDSAENYVKKSIGPADLHKALKPWIKDLNRLIKRTENADSWGVENEWAFDADWKSVKWNNSNARFRAKLDFFSVRGTTGYYVDYKSGKVREGHVHQNDCYAALMILKYPQLKKIRGEFWYVDQNHIGVKDYTARQARDLLAMWSERLEELVQVTEFPAKSNWSCQWCNFSKAKGGPCQEGLRNR